MLVINLFSIPLSSKEVEFEIQDGSFLNLYGTIYQLFGTIKMNVEISKDGVDITCVSSDLDIEASGSDGDFFVTGIVSHWLSIDTHSSTGLPSYDSYSRFVLTLPGQEEEKVLSSYSVLSRPSYFPNLSMYGICETINTEISIRTIPTDYHSLYLFRRGEVNGDDVIDLSDAITILKILFLSKDEKFCLKATDANDDGFFMLDDAIYLLSSIFLGGDELPPPGKPCGFDLTEDTLDCDQLSWCTSQENI